MEARDEVGAVGSPPLSPTQHVQLSGLAGCEKVGDAGVEALVVVRGAAQLCGAVTAKRAGKSAERAAPDPADGKAL